MNPTRSPEDRSDPTAGADEVKHLLEVMARLRGEGGCPWDREQTHRSLVPYLIEEAYEVAEVIEASEDGEAGVNALREELGDLLLQVVFHARIAEEAGQFGFADVAAGIATKLTERHPHVFDGLQVESREELGKLWHRSKMRRKDSALDGIPERLPALQRAAKVSSAAAHAGFEWRRMDEILGKAREELDEFADAVAQRNAGQPVSGSRPVPTAEMETEFGDLMFALVQVARWQRIDPEAALRRATRKFSARFRWMEAHQDGAGEERIPEQWEALWARAKAEFPA